MKKIRQELAMRVSLESEAMVSEEPACDLRLVQSNLDLTLSDSQGMLLTIPYSQAGLLLQRLSGEAHIQRLRGWAERAAPPSESPRLRVSRKTVEIGGQLEISFRPAPEGGKALLLGIDSLGTVSLLRVPAEAPDGQDGDVSVRVIVGPPAGALDLCLLLFERAPVGLPGPIDIQPGTPDLASFVRSLREARPIGGLLKRIEVEPAAR